MTAAKRTGNADLDERSKNRYVRFWRAAYLRMADGELRVAVFRGRFENLSLRSVQIRAHECDFDLDRWLTIVASHAPTRVDEATAGQLIHAAS